MTTPGDRILILGATSAIAQATARAWAAQGATFFLVARSAAKLTETAADLATRGGHIAGTAALDLGVTERHPGLIEQAAAALGGRIDTALLAHGVLGSQDAATRDFATAHALLHINFTSPISLLTALANRMEAARHGTLIVIGSVAGDRGRQSNYVYGAAKGGLAVFVQGLRNRLCPAGVHVITVKPGFVDTPMTAHLPKNPLFAAPEAIAQGILRAQEQRSDIVYLPWFWRYLMLVIRAIPERVFKRLRL